MFKDYIEKSNFEDTGFSYALSLIRGKYKMVILYCLMEFEIVRYNELKRYIKSISLNFHTPFKGTEYLALDQNKKAEIIDMIISYKKKSYPIMNSVAGLKKMKNMDFKPQCWVTNFIFSDGTKKTQCIGNEEGVCDKCGFCMAGEMNALFNFHPGTVIAGLKLRLQ